MHDDELTRRIAAGDWAEQPPAAPRVANVLRLVLRRRRRRVAAASGTGLVCALAVVALLVTSPSGDTAPPASSPSTAPTGSASAARLCPNQDLEISLGTATSHAHHSAQPVLIANIGDSLCRVPIPDIYLEAPHDASIQVVGTNRIHDALLPGGQVLALTISTSTVCPSGGPAAPATVVRIEPGDGWVYRDKGAALSYGCGQAPRVSAVGSYPAGG